MMMVLYVAFGSAIGGAARLLVGTMIQQRTGTMFPLGTLVINITGSLVLGFLMRYTLGTSAVSPEVRGLLTTGLCGGFTTFSTFSFETMTLLEDGELARAGWYVALSVAVSLLGVYLGFVAARELLLLRHR